MPGRHNRPKSACKCGAKFAPAPTATGRNRYRCNACNAQAAVIYRKANVASVAVTERKRSQQPTRMAALKVWNRISRLRRFGLTIEEYNRMLSAQNGLCRICGEAETSLSATIDPFTGDRVVKMLAVDHDHETGVALPLEVSRTSRSRITPPNQSGADASSDPGQHLLHPRLDLRPSEVRVFPIHLKRKPKCVVRQF